MMVRRFIPLAALLLLALTPGVAQAAQQCGGHDATRIGTNGADVLIGTTGDDWFWGGPGDDTLIGLGGNDVFCTGPGSDNVVGGPGTDTLDYSWLGPPAPGNGESLFIDLAVGAANEQDDGGGVDVFVGVEAVNGSPFRDKIEGSAANDTIRGNGGNDEIEGRWGVDWIDGGPGDDAVYASSFGNPDFVPLGTEIVYGGPGDDTLNGFENGPSALFGGPGNDRLETRDADDFLDGGDGSDWGDAGDGDDVCVNLETAISCNP